MSDRMRRRRTTLLAGLLLVAACHPVVVRPGATTIADVTVPTQPTTDVNILGIGRTEASGQIVLRSTGIAVARGETAMVGIMGPGMIPGTGFVVLGFHFQANIVRYGETQGGSGPLPAAVVSLVVPADTPPGLYSIVAVRGFQFSVLSASIEVL
jgi:hypothetical protein